MVKDEDDPTQTQSKEKLTPIVDINTENGSKIVDVGDVKYAYYRGDRAMKSRRSLVSGNTTVGVSTSVDPTSMSKNNQMKRL